eukprot:12011958-Ditylum_brightwellii.AAC.1
MASFTPTSSASVELRVLIFCFVDMEYGLPFPNVIVAPVWLRICGWTAYDASTHHLMTPPSSASK